MIERIFDILDKYFVQILFVNLFGWFCFGFVLIFARVRQTLFPFTNKSLTRVLYFVVSGLQSLLFIILVCIFIANYQPEKPVKPNAVLNLSAKVTSSTDWVKEDVLIYFISGHELVSIYPNGNGRKTVLTALEDVRGYHFSPDGKYILAVTETSLYQYNRKTDGLAVIENIRLDGIEESSDAHAVIHKIRWSPDSSMYCYNVAKWSRYSSSEDWFLYDTRSGSRKPIDILNFKAGSLEWGADGKNLYFTTYDSNDTGDIFKRYTLKIYKVPLDTLRPELVLKYPSQKPVVLPEEMLLLGINLFAPGNLSFIRKTGKEHFLDFKDDAILGVDEYDYLFFVKYGLWKKRLYKIPRIPSRGLSPQYPYRVDDLAIRNLSWLPSGKYVIMGHYLYGILILEPSTEKVGILVNELGDTFGWHEKISN